MVMKWNHPTRFERDPAMVNQVLNVRRKRKYELMANKLKTKFYTQGLQEIADFNLIDPKGDRNYFPMDMNLFPWLFIKGGQVRATGERTLRRVQDFFERETVILSREYKDLVPNNLGALRNRVRRILYEKDREGRGKLCFRVYTDIVHLFIHTLESLVIHRTTELEEKYPEDTVVDTRRKSELRQQVRSEIILEFLITLYPQIEDILPGNYDNHRFYWVRKFYDGEKEYMDASGTLMDERLIDNYYFKAYFLVESRRLFKALPELQVPKAKPRRVFPYRDMLNNPRKFNEAAEFINQMYIWDTLSGTNPREVGLKMRKLMDLSSITKI